jgi:hypothetical protein
VTALVVGLPAVQFQVDLEFPGGISAEEGQAIVAAMLAQCFDHPDAPNPAKVIYRGVLVHGFDVDGRQVDEVLLEGVDRS